MLNMTSAGRLDRVVRYGANSCEALENAVKLWETAAGAVAARETCILKLERFERQASDPHRFFHAALGARLKREEHQRAKLHEELGETTKAVEEALIPLEEQLNDIAEVGGRNYR
jgi:hypothetical protein